MQGADCTAARRGRRALASAKARDQLAVSRREIEFLETFWRHPFHRLRFAGLDGSRLEPASIEVDHDRPFRVVPPDGLDFFANGEARRYDLSELSPKRPRDQLTGVP